MTTFQHDNIDAQNFNQCLTCFIASCEYLEFNRYDLFIEVVYFILSIDIDKFTMGSTNKVSRLTKLPTKY